MDVLFGHGNPLTTPVGLLIDQATGGCQATENWALYMEVCDSINETDEGPKDAIRAFRKKISQNVGKNYTAVMQCLTCIESCVKNGGRRFHIHVATKDFLHDLIKIIGPKNDPPQVVQEKVLSMIQTWADAFRGNAELKEMEKVYQELKQKGIEFPMTDLDQLAHIHTPARSVPEQDQSVRGGSSRGQPTALIPAAFPPGGCLPAAFQPGGCPSGGCPPAMYSPPVSGNVDSEGPMTGTPLTSDQTTKLRLELEVVHGNIRVMSEMLTELSPTNVNPSDLELLQELNRTCRKMQSRVVELLNEISTEEVTNDLLGVNDDLNNLFLRYERFERYRTNQSGLTSTETKTTLPDSQPPAYDQLPAASNHKVGNLIDLSDDSSIPTAQMTSLALNNPGANNTAPVRDDAFDMLAQSRQSFDQNKQVGTNYANQQEDTQSGGLGQAVAQKTMVDNPNLQDKDTDYDEMEQWLATHGGPNSDGKSQEPITSSGKQ